MKKLLVAAAALAAGVASASIVSSSIVGYNTLTINKEYTLLTINFDAVDGSALTVQQAFPYCEGMTEAKVYGSADNIQVMNADGGYDTYFMWNGASGKNGVADPTKRGWAKAGTTSLTTDTLPKGATMWYQSRAAKYDDTTTHYNLTVAGAVSLAEKYEYTLDKEYTLVGNPFPVEIALNGGVVLTEPTAAKGYSSADNVQIMTEDGGYEIYFMWNGASGKNGVANPDLQGWAKAGTTSQTSDKFPVGRGAWFQARNPSGTAKLRFVNPVGVAE